LAPSATGKYRPQGIFAGAILRRQWAETHHSRVLSADPAAGPFRIDPIRARRRLIDPGKRTQENQILKQRNPERAALKRRQTVEVGFPGIFYRGRPPVPFPHIAAAKP
jgi:hypothetical protein